VVTQTPENIKLLAGRLSLDFANTVDWDESGSQLPETDALSVPHALDRWAARLGDPAALTAPPDLSRVKERPEAAGADSPATAGPPGLIAVRAFRDSLYSLFAAVADGGLVSPDALSLLQAVHADGVAAAQIEPRGGGFVLAWPDAEPRRVLYAVAADAVALLADQHLLARVHRCPGRNCGWFFLNTSGRQRWCSMATCGSRAKMRAMYARRRDVSGPSRAATQAQPSPST
jgi:predicted RNA-binding Zn ribbon-like protein